MYLSLWSHDSNLWLSVLISLWYQKIKNILILFSKHTLTQYPSTSHLTMKNIKRQIISINLKNMEYNIISTKILFNDFLIPR